MTTTEAAVTVIVFIACLVFLAWMSRGAARTFTDAAVRANKLARRIGIVRATGRRAWMYRIKEDAHK